MFRRFLPNLKQTHLYQNVSQRSLHCPRHYGRWSPLVRRPTFGELFDELVPRNVFQHMDRSFRDMEKVMGEWTRRIDQEMRVRDKRYFSEDINKEVINNTKFLKIKKINFLYVWYFFPSNKI